MHNNFNFLQNWPVFVHRFWQKKKYVRHISEGDASCMGAVLWDAQCSAGGDRRDAFVYGFLTEQHGAMLNDAMINALWADNERCRHHSSRRDTNRYWRLLMPVLTAAVSTTSPWRPQPQKLPATWTLYRWGQSRQQSSTRVWISIRPTAAAAAVRRLMSLLFHWWLKAQYTNVNVAALSKTKVICRAGLTTMPVMPWHAPPGSGGASGGTNFFLNI